MSVAVVEEARGRVVPAAPVGPTALNKMAMANPVAVAEAAVLW